MNLRKFLITNGVEKQFLDGKLDPGIDRGDKINNLFSKYLLYLKNEVCSSKMSIAEMWALAQDAFRPARDYRNNATSVKELRKTVAEVLSWMYETSGCDELPNLAQRVCGHFHRLQFEATASQKLSSPRGTVEIGVTRDKNDSRWFPCITIGDRIYKSNVYISGTGIASEKKIILQVHHMFESDAFWGFEVYAMMKDTWFAWEINMTQGGVIFSLVRVGVPYPSFCMNEYLVRQGDVKFNFHFPHSGEETTTTEKPDILRSCKFDPEPEVVKLFSRITLLKCRVDTCVKHPDHPTVKLREGSWMVTEVEGKTQHVPSTDSRD
jgi:hypothetical protein